MNARRTAACDPDRRDVLQSPAHRKGKARACARIDAASTKAYDMTKLCSSVTSRSDAADVTRSWINVSRGSTVERLMSAIALYDTYTVRYALRSTSGRTSVVIGDNPSIVRASSADGV